MLIFQLSTDALSIITSHLNGSDVFRLIICGDRQLAAKIASACGDLYCEVLPFTPFPFSAFTLPHLRSLHVFYQVSYYALPLKLNRLPPLPSCPVPSLTTLSLSFAQSFHVLRLEGSSPVLERLFPNLRTLDLAHYVRKLERHHLLALPRTLTAVSLRSTYFSSPSSYTRFSHLDLALLPPDLESIYISNLFITGDAATNRFDGITWPVKLKKLTMRYFENHNILHQLPPEIEHLDIEMADNNISGEFRTSQLPRSLTSCNIAGVLRRPFSIVPDGKYPPQLKTFQVNLKFDDVSKLVGLPPTLTECRQLSTVVAALRLDLLPHIRSLHCSCPKIPDFVLQHQLPRNLVSLSSSGTKPDLIPWESLPKTLTFVCLQIGSEEHAAMIPRGVRRISIPQDCSYALSSRACSLFPPHLSALTLWLHQIENIECLSQLPSTWISSLDISMDSATKSEIAMDPHLSRHLRGMKRLSEVGVTISGADSCWREWVVDLDSNHFPLLNSLVVAVDTPTEREWKQPSHYIKSLATSLTEVGVILSNTCDDDPLLFASLPPKLHTLILMSPYVPNADTTPTIAVNDAQFAHLPASLTYLNIDCCTGLTPRLFYIIPPNISDLEVPSYLPKSALDNYFRKDHWEGHSGHFVELSTQS